MKKADLHIHSFYSDSSLSFEDIFYEANKENISCIAITDHDTIENHGLIRELQDRYQIECIPGVEISAYKDGVELHVLGYFIEDDTIAFREYQENVRKSRKERLVFIIEKLKELGIIVDKDEFLSYIEDKTTGRLHLALYLRDKGYVRSVLDAFKLYLSPGKPAYVDRVKLEVKEAIKLIRESHGLPFLAHPHILANTDWIKEFVEYGLAGLEVIYPKYTPEQINKYCMLAENLGLLKSGGSDSHGEYKEFTRIGKVTIPYEWVKEMKDERERVFYKKDL